MARAPRTGSPHGRRQTRHELIEEVVAHEEPTFDEASSVLRQTYGPRFQLFISAQAWFEYLAEMAQMLDYAVTVCDPREKLLNDFGVAGARGVTDMPDDAVKAYANDAASAIVALTHDPRIDDMGLMEALKTPAFYVGAMGSVKTSAGRRKRLQLLDVTDTELARLRAPIGLPIGSKTPPEIAIAILAEITAVRKQREKQTLSHLAAIASPAAHRKRGLPPPQRDERRARHRRRVLAAVRQRQTCLPAQARTAADRDVAFISRRVRQRRRGGAQQR